MSTAEGGLARTDITKHKFWVVVGLIILNHLVIDPVLTVYRMHTRSALRELNPIWRELIRSDPTAFLLFQLPMIGLIIGAYFLIFRLIAREQPPWDTRLVKGIWYASLVVVAWGLFSTFHHIWFLAIRG